MKIRSHHRADQWQHHIDVWQASGTTQSIYCKTHDLLLHRFQYWKNRLARVQAGAPAAAPVAASTLVQNTPHPAFIPLTLIDPPAKTQVNDNAALIATPTALTLHVGERYRIDLTPGFHAATLRELLAALEA